MTTREALEIALTRMAIENRATYRATDQTLKARRVLEAILAQRGCEDFDPAVTDGRLTTLMDVVIYG